MLIASGDPLLDLAWRIIVGVSLVPAFGTLYQRLVLPESERFRATRKTATSVPADEDLEKVTDGKLGDGKEIDTSEEDTPATTPAAPKKAHWAGASMFYVSCHIKTDAF
jgi:MFS transporter, PHS family, inorganic phosphate transporter